MSNIQFVAQGISGMAAADANVGDYKIASDGTVKERNFFSKIFTRIMDHFERKSAEGCERINQRNLEIGNAMMRMVTGRLQEKFRSMDAEATTKSIPHEELLEKKRAMTAGVERFKNNIALLANCKEMPRELLNKVKQVSPDALDFLRKLANQELWDKMTNLLTCNVDPETYQRGFREILLQGIDTDYSKIFHKDASRGIVHCPDAEYSRKNPVAIRAYFDQISNETPEVSQFLVNICNQNGMPYALMMTLMGQSSVQDPNLPTNEECNAAYFSLGNSKDTRLRNDITITAREDGSIDASAQFNFQAFNGGVNGSDPSNICILRASLDMHLPVDEHGAFLMRDGHPDFVIEHSEVSNVHFD